MTIVYIVVCCLPVLLVFLVILAIGAAGSRTFRAGKIAYREVKPYVDDITAKASRAQKMTADFSERGMKLSETFQEIAGRWAFVTGEVAETAQSPVVKMAGMAGRFIGGRGD